MSTRLGIVRYLNTKPIVFGLETGRVSHQFELVYDVPSACARMLRAGEVDAALIPAVEYASHHDFCIVPTISISSFGPVATVALYFSGGLGDIRTVALDTSSLNSVALLKILLERRFGLHPSYRSMEPVVGEMLRGCDAALIIGDTTFQVDGAIERLDVGEEWRRWTGLPCTFAFWAGRCGALSRAEVGQLILSKEIGVRSIAEIARRESGVLNLSVEEIERYLRRNIQYDLGEREQEGLQRFYREASGLGLIPRVPELKFYATEDRAEA